MADRQQKKILIVSFTLNPSGTTRLAIDDAVALRNQGFSVAFASEKGPLETELQEKEIPFYPLYLVNSEKYPRWVRYILGIPITTLLLLYIKLRNGYDFLYVQHRQSGIPCTIMSCLTSAKYVFIAHTELGKLNTGRILTPLGNHIITVSAKIKENITSYFGVPENKITVISNATNTDVVYADKKRMCDFDKKWDIANDAPVVACVAMLVEIKAHDFLLNAWQRVLWECPNAILVLAGDGPLFDDLVAQSVALGIDRNVRFLGLVNDVSVVYSRASIVVLASKSEGLPTCILEAFAYGVPAVATAVSGTPEIVLHEETGILVETQNVTQLSQALVRLLCDVSLRQQLGQAGRYLVEKKYSQGVRANSLGNYFRHLDP